MAEDKINPSWYRRGGYELIDVIEAWGLDEFGHLMQAVQYIFRAPHKKQLVEDLEKAKWYIDRALEVCRQDSALPKDIEKDLVRFHDESP